MCLWASACGLSAVTKDFSAMLDVCYADGMGILTHTYTRIQMAPVTFDSGIFVLVRVYVVTYAYTYPHPYSGVRT